MSNELEASALTDTETASITPTGATPPRASSKFNWLWLKKPNVLALFGSALLAALYGRVALFNLGTGVVGGDFDGYENLWNDDWVRRALFELHTNPFYTKFLYYPTGISLRYHTLNPLNGIFALPLWPLIGSVASTNLLFLISIALTCFCAYLFFKDLVSAALPAFAGATIFTFTNDQLYGFYSFGQAEKLSQWWLPLYLWLIGRTLNRPRWWLYGGGAVVTLIAMALTDWQFVLYAVLLTASYGLFDLIWRRRFDGFLKLAGIGVVWAAIVAVPLLLPMIKDAADNPWLVVGDESDSRARALGDFFEVGLGNPGYIVLILTIVGLVIWWRRGIAKTDRPALVFWTIAAVLASILTLGPHLRVWSSDTDVTGINLPYAWLGSLPILNIGRDPGRYYMIALLGFGLLFAFALRELRPTVDRLLTARLKLPVMRTTSALLVGVVLAVTLFGFMVQAGDARIDPPDWPQFYYQLAQDKDNYAIMELPLFTEKGRGEDTYEAYQSIHGKARLGGRLARDHKLTYPNNFTKQATLFRDFFWATRSLDATQIYRPTKAADFLTPPDLPQWSVPLLNFYKVRYIILYLDALNETSPDALGQAEGMVHVALGANARPVYQDAKMEAYLVPPNPASLSLPNNSLFLDTGSTGWYSAEKNADGVSYRWANSQDGEDAQLLAFNLDQNWHAANLKFSLFNYKSAREVIIKLDGQTIAQKQLQPSETQSLDLPISLSPGMHQLTLESPQPSVPVGSPSDSRSLSFGVSGPITLTAN